VGLASDDINPGYRMWAGGLLAHVPITTLWIMSEDDKAHDRAFCPAIAQAAASAFIEA
jgi:hypothetical protein